MCWLQLELRTAVYYPLKLWRVSRDAALILLHRQFYFSPDCAQATSFNLKIYRVFTAVPIKHHSSASHFLKCIFQCLKRARKATSWGSNVLFSFIMFSPIKTVQKSLHLLLSCALCIRSPHNVIALAVKTSFCHFHMQGREKLCSKCIFLATNEIYLVALYHYTDNNKGVYLMTVNAKHASAVPWSQIQCRAVTSGFC